MFMEITMEGITKVQGKATIIVDFESAMSCGYPNYNTSTDPAWRTNIIEN